MSSGDVNKRKREENVNNEASPAGRRVSARFRPAAETGQDSENSPSSSSTRSRSSPGAGAGRPTRTSPRKSLPQARNDTCTSPSRGRQTPVKRAPRKVGSRKVKTLAEKDYDLRRDYTSDGMSFESLPDDDLPDINIASSKCNALSPYKGKQYAKDDIVWAPFNSKYEKTKIFWPAVVTSVAGFYVRFLYINFYEKPIYRVHARNLIPFDDSTRNWELQKLGSKVRDFKEAYELVIKYYCKRKQNTTLNARRFLTLTYDENDKVGLARNSLFRLTGKLHSHSDNLEEDEEVEEVEVEVDDVDIVNDVNIVNDVDIDEEDENCEEETKPNSPQSERIKEILEDLETLPTHMTVSMKKREQMQKEAENLLSIIQSKECFDHLMEIRQGTLETSRHRKFMKGVKVHGGLGPFTLFPDLTDQLLSALDNHCDFHDTYDYKYNVMIPEAIIFAIMKHRNISKLDAKKYFYLTCKKLGIRD
ncbi:Major viral transcription factor ICP4-like protein [Frankliniella fusca]|uniref:Major viral transcription factor ICP4-like protein n=1 Tax=Frankliniella fusca TaxID=407009 RepID=A0AAE1LS10_9NEOP|nr:Major viral transcription factor ICP4-like protein [Frankliniella fusca]